MKNYGQRVQYSVFECILNDELRGKLRSEITKIIDDNEDSVRIYRLCERCARAIEIIGVGEVTSRLDFRMV